MIKNIACVQASDMPEEVEEWCVGQEISTHYQSDVVCITDEDNPFCNWLKKLGYKFEGKKYHYVAIVAT